MIGGETSLDRIPDIGCTLETVFMSSGNNLFLTSVSALHVTKVCSVESVIDVLHRVHVRTDVELSVSHCVLSVMRSQVRNLRCKQSFCSSVLSGYLGGLGGGALISRSAVHSEISFLSSPQTFSSDFSRARL